MQRLDLPQTGHSSCPTRIAGMGALYGFLAENGLFEQTLIVSNGASQFKIGQSANYWVHQERLFQKLWIGHEFKKC
ncbi:MAG: hypothetical protein OXE41_05525 [Gammaproteobacteria bacterium]|nr:hypothetical protein [Gammaproteobacteria bacterium]